MDLEQALGHHQKGELNRAILLYQHVLSLEPNHSGALHFLGLAYYQSGANAQEQGINLMKEAHRLAPENCTYLTNLGQSLGELGNIEEAVYYLEQSIMLRPMASNHYQLGNLYQQLGELEHAQIAFESALILEPNFAEAHNNLGNLLRGQGHSERAQFHLEQALPLPQAHYNLGLLFERQGQTQRAAEHFLQALQLQPDFPEAQWHYGLLLPVLYETPAQIPAWRSRYFQGLQHLIQTITEPQQALRGLSSLTSFYLGYQGQNDLDFQSIYGDYLHQMLTKLYPHLTCLNQVREPHAKIRVGYLSAHLRDHTVGKLSLGWLKYHDRGQFWIYGYYLGCKPDEVTKQFKQLSDVYYHLPSSLIAIAEQILTDQLDILVFLDIGMHPLTNVVAGLRLAPVQCTTWCHPVTSGLPTIDYFLSSELMEPKDGDDHYRETMIRLPNLGVAYVRPHLPPLTKTRQDFKLSENGTLYLCCQSLFKYLPQYDDLFPNIALWVPGAQFIFIGHHELALTQRFEQRLERAFGDLDLNWSDFCVMLPRLSQQDYAQLNQLADIFLDSWGWSGGNTTLEALACGLPVVTCPGDYLRGRHSYGILQMLGIYETIAENALEYVDIAIGLGLDPVGRTILRQKILAQSHRLWDDPVCIQALEDFYRGVRS